MKEQEKYIIKLLLERGYVQRDGCWIKTIEHWITPMMLDELCRTRREELLKLIK